MSLFISIVKRVRKLQKPKMDKTLARFFGVYTANWTLNCIIILLFTFTGKGRLVDLHVARHMPTDTVRQSVNQPRFKQKKLNYCTSKVGQSAEPSHWHFPLPGSLTQLKKIRYITVKLSGCVRNAECYLQRLCVFVLKEMRRGAGVTICLCCLISGLFLCLAFSMSSAVSPPTVVGSWW